MILRGNKRRCSVCWGDSSAAVHAVSSSGQWILTGSDRLAFLHEYTQIRRGGCLWVSMAAPSWTKERNVEKMQLHEAARWCCKRRPRTTVRKYLLCKCILLKVKWVFVFSAKLFHPILAKHKTTSKRFLGQLPEECVGGGPVKGANEFMNEWMAWETLVRTLTRSVFEYALSRSHLRSRPVLSVSPSYTLTYERVQ